MFIDHIGIVAPIIDQSIEEWHRVFGYHQLTEVVVNTRQKAKVVFLSKPDSLTIKLIQPLNNESPIYTYSSRGGGLHHLCFKCDHVQSEIGRLQGLGLRLLKGPEAGEAFDNHQIAFLYAHDNLNIELIDTPVKASLKQDAAQ